MKTTYWPTGVKSDDTEVDTRYVQSIISNIVIIFNYGVSREEEDTLIDMVNVGDYNLLGYSAV
jgi:hypothetical protein